MTTFNTFNKTHTVDMHLGHSLTCNLEGFIDSILLRVGTGFGGVKDQSEYNRFDEAKVFGMWLSCAD